MDLNQLFEHGQEMAIKVFNGQGEILPTWILVTADGELVPLIIPSWAMEDKDKVVEVLAKVFRDGRIIRYVSLLEAWCVIGKSKEQMKDVLDNIDITPIREHPERIEVVHIQAEDKHHMLSGQFRIIRPANNKPFLSRFEKNDADRSEGRFCNLLAANEAIH